MDKDTFKQMLQELADAGELELDIGIKDGRLHVALTLNGAKLASNYVYCSSIRNAVEAD